MVAALNDTIPDRDKNGPPRVSFGIRGRGEQKDRDEHLNDKLARFILLGGEEFGHGISTDRIPSSILVIKRSVSNQFFDLSKELILIRFY